MILYNMLNHPVINETSKQEKESSLRLKCGKFNGYCKWDLAKDWLRMSNDSFFRLYGFNWVPPMWMYEKARDFI